MEPIYVEITQWRDMVNTNNFAADDLSIFVESLETLSRIERERKERRQRRKSHKLISKKSSVEPVNGSLISFNTTIAEDSSSTEEDIVQQPKPDCPKQFKTHADDSPVQSSDENYFSGASVSESLRASSKDSIPSDEGAFSPPTDSGTESESGGVFQLRPRSSAMANPKYRTTRARIIGLVLKREYAEGGSHDELEKQERRERVLEDLLREKVKCESLRLPTREGSARTPIIIPEKNSKKATAEMKFLDKALRYLTL